MLDTGIAVQETIRSRPLHSRPAPQQRGSFATCLADGAVRVVPAGHHLFCQGDPATHVYRVESGHILLYRMLPDGHRQVVDFAMPGDLIGLGALREHTNSAQATECSCITSHSINMVHERAGRDPSLVRELYMALSLELSATRELLVTVTRRTASERLAAFLLALARRNERRGKDSSVVVLPMSRIDIADFLGLTIETVSRTFTKFRRAGLIDLEQCILVTIRDLGKLEAVAAGAVGPGSEQLGDGKQLHRCSIVEQRQ